MSHTTETEWPENGVPEAVKKVIDTLLETFDNNTEDAGEKLAKYVFTPDAELHSSAGTFHGHAEIGASRKEAWKIVTYRRHDVLKVFSAANDSSDLMWIGHAVLKLTNDKEVSGPFLAHIKFANVDSEDVRIKYFKVWGDSGPMLKILQEFPIPNK